MSGERVNRAARRLAERTLRRRQVQRNAPPKRKVKRRKR